MRFFSVIAASAFALSTPAFAQAIAPGMQVVDSAGAAVGTVKSVDGDNVLVKTDKHEVQIPKTSFAVDAGKLLFGMTQEQLNAAAEKSMATANASIVAGATVKGIGGSEIGKIDSVADGKVTIALSAGQKIQVPDSGVRGNPDGTVTIGFSSAQIQDLISKSSAVDSTPAPTSGQ
jgi:preprotein translocase subunit YajC